ncbi:SPOR domain-containing protein [Ensifer sp. SSB1]|uniref:SPOR domain-containing protein n=1 Tax=Ensifer sp. SSB1 TaxID=2795385 RepID=UPI001A4B2488|nr:SPOR domain-containing protein [Ensifer sp. SSB1]MBK5567577.1 SPOR domain-containing protein [Ensifer sp. SSB1]
MADKQFARSGPAEFDVLADDDPLAELARIVGYDARPAVQQLQELQRHQEAVRQDPAFDLEDELLRAFDSYDAPRAAEQPAVEPVSAPQPAEEARIEPVAELAEEYEAPIFRQPEPVAAPAAVVEDESEPVVEVQSFTPAPQLVETDSTEFAADEPAFDLERELELSLGEADLLPFEDEPASEVREEVVEDWRAPVEEPITAWAEPAPVVEPTPVYAEPAPVVHVEPAPVYVEPTPDYAEPVFDVAPEERADDAAYANETVAEGGAEHEAAGDDLLADVERFPVPPVAAVVAAAVQSHPALHATEQLVVAPAAAPVNTVAAPLKKSPYPFTPTFSRATPVASATGASQQRAFAGPLVSQAAPVAAPVIAAVVTPAATPVVEAAQPVQAAQVVAEPENEPGFDIENFEMELSDAALKLDLADLGPTEPVAVAPAVVPQAVAQPVIEAPVMEAVAPQREPERSVETFVAEAPVEQQDAQPESTLPFDPSMIAEAENGVAPIADMDVPQLPVIETEKPVVYPADYDLDIDAEMAQLFGTPAPAAKDVRPVAAEKVEAARPAPAASANPSFGTGGLDDFDAFEKAMEEDFRRSMTERQSPVRDAERVSAGQREEDAGDYRDYGSGRRSQRTILLAASVAGVIILGGAAVYAWMGGSDAATTAEGPKIILADKGPVKVVPEEKGGKTVPNQDKAVYDRVAGAQAGAPQQDALVSSTEEPMDVVQKTLTPETLPLEGSDDSDGLQANLPADDEDGARLLPDGGAQTAAQEEDKAPAVAPRKVRTMIVKPDGTLVAREEPVAAPATDVAGTAQPLPDAPSKEVASADVTAAGQASASVDQVALAATGNANIEQVPVRNVTTTATGDKAPKPQTRPAEQANAAAAPADRDNVRPVDEQAVAAAAEAQPAQQVATASVPAGGYFIQVASLPSEAEAQKSYNSLSSKFGNVIGGRGVDIRKAEIAGKGTYYRVRIPAGSKEEANALCSKYKGAGGSCLVTK